MRFSRTFSANPGDYSTGTAGPDQIEYDLDQIAKNLDPTQDGGGITADNIPDSAITAIKIADDAVTDGKMGNRTVDPTLAGGSNTGTLTQILSWFGKIVKAITGKTNWFDLPSKSIEELVSYDDYLLSQLQGVVLNQIPDGTVTDAKLSSEAKQNLIYEEADGTGTGITLATASLTDGHSKTFIASINNNSAATTINGVPVYKPNTTDAPTLIAGKAYTVWYDSTGGCFFLKASANGDAVAGNVLAGKTFSNDNDTDLTGEMTNNGIMTIAPSAVDQALEGYYASGSKVNGVVLAPGIKSIQYVQISVSDTTATAIINSVVPANTVIVFNGRSGVDASSPRYFKVRVELTDATTVTAHLNTHMGTPIVNVMVIEFESGIVKSKQAGSFNLSAATTAVTITSVDTAKTLLFYCGSATNSDDTANSQYYTDCRIALTNSTTITASLDAYLYSVTIGWNLVEFY